MTTNFLMLAIVAAGMGVAGLVFIVDMIAASSKNKRKEHNLVNVINNAASVNEWARGERIIHLIEDSEARKSRCFRSDINCAGSRCMAWKNVRTDGGTDGTKGYCRLMIKEGYR